MKIQLSTLLLIFAAYSGIAQSKTDLVRSYQFANNALDSSASASSIVTPLTYAYGRFCDNSSALSAINNSAGFSINHSTSGAASLYLNEYTYSAWVKLSQIPSPSITNYIIGIGGYGADQTLLLTSAGFGASSYYTTASSQAINAATVMGTTKPKLETWYHVVSVKRDDSLLIYVNGKLENKKFLLKDNFTKYSTTDAGAYIASRSGEVSLRGFIDAVQIYKRGLTSTEVANLYNTDKNKICDKPQIGLVRDFRFTNNLKDSSSSQTHALATTNVAVGLTNGRFCETNGAALIKGNGSALSSSATAVNGSSVKSGTYTFASWIKLNARPKEQYSAGIITIGDLDTSQCLAVSKSSFSASTYHISNGTKSSTKIMGTTLPQIGKWYHVVSVRKNDSLLLYINGNVETKAVLPGNNKTYYSDGIQEVYIGQKESGVPEIFNGAIDDVKVYDMALNATEIKALYQQNKNKTICETPAPTGLVRDYRFAGNIKDSSALAAHLPSAPAFNNGRFCETNGSAYIPSVSTGLDIPFTSANNASLDLDNYTYSTWVKMITRPGAGSSYELINIGEGKNGQAISIKNNYFMAHAGYVTTSGVVIDSLPGTTLPQPNKWYHIVSVKKQDSLLLYVNGIAEGKKRLSSPLYTEYGNAPVAKIGYRTRVFNGFIDDLKIYDRPLTAIEVKALYQNNSGKTICPDLLPVGIVRDYRFTNNTLDSSTVKSNISTVPVYSEGRFCTANTAATLNGTIQSLSVPFTSLTHYSLDLNTYTYSTWVKLNLRPGNTTPACIFSAGGNDFNQTMFVKNTSFNMISHCRDNAGNVLNLELTGTTVPDTYKWYHITTVRKSDSILLYVNGVVEAKKIIPAGYVVDYSASPGASIGNRAGYSSLLGSIDDFKIYDKALTAGEVNDLYHSNGGKTVCSPALIPVMLRNYEFENSKVDSSSFVTNFNSSITFVKDRFCETYSAGGFGKYFSPGITIPVTSSNGYSLDTKTYTYSAWFKINETPANDSTGVLIIGSHAVTVGPNNIGARAYVRDINTKSIKKVEVKTPMSPLVGKWYQVVCVKKADSLILFVNGKLEASQVISYPHLPNYGDVFVAQIGGSDDYSTFSGSIDAVRIYNYALTQNQVSTLYTDNKGRTICPVPTDSLLREYRFTNNLSDSSTYLAPLNNVATPVYTDDQACKAKSAITVPANGLVSPVDGELLLNTYTYSAWVRPTALPATGNSQAILGIGNTGGDQTMSIANGQFRVTAYSASPLTNTSLPSATYITQGFWYHLTMVKTLDSLYFYVDGLLERKTKLIGAGTGYGNYAQAGIGTRPAGGMLNFIGDISDIKIYNVALKKDRILELYNQTKAGSNCTTGISDDVINDDVVKAYINDNKEIVIISSQKINSIQLNNIWGQSENFGSTNIIKTNLKGVLVIRVETAKGLHTQKIVME